MVVLSVSGQLVLNAVIACQDKSIKVLVDNTILYQQKLDSACTALSIAPEQTHRYCPIIGYGLKNGGIGCIELTRDEPILMWSVEGPQTNGSSVSLVKCCSFFSEPGYYNLIVARDDGSLEIYSYEHKSPIPTLRFETKIEESITGIDVGFITNPNQQEIMITTYSGKVMSLSDSGKFKGEALAAKGENVVIKREKQDKIAVMQAEVEMLKKKQKELEQVEKKESEKMVYSLGLQGEQIDFGEPFKVAYKLNILPKEAAYSLFIDSQLPIDCLLLQSVQNIDIMSVKDNICSINKITDKSNSSTLLATLKVNGDQSKHSRVEIKIRTSEGQMGNLNVIVMPRPDTGNKTCQCLDVPLKPLNLHERIDKVDDKILEKLPLSKIKIHGKFSLSDGHNWISNFIPDVPPNVSSDEQNQTHFLYFKSTFVGTYLIIELKKGELIVQSDNISVITIIKDSLTNDASQKKIALEIESQIDDSCIYRTLSLLNPLVQEQYTIAQKNQIIDGLKELQMQEEDTSYLSQEYKEILLHADDIRAQFKLQPRKLVYLWGIIADLYMDTAKIKGHHNVQPQKMAQLKGILNQYSYDELVQFFQQSW